MASSIASRSSASFSWGSCWVAVMVATARLYQLARGAGTMRKGVRLGGSGLRSPTRATPQRDVQQNAGSENPDADELARGEIPPRAACHRTDEVEDAAALLVAAHRLDGRAKRCVQDEIQRQQLAVEPLARRPERQRDEDALLA